MAIGQIKRLGELLIADGVITKDQLREALLWQQQNPGTRIGEILVNLGYTDVKTIIATLAKQRSSQVKGKAEDGKKKELESEKPKALKLLEREVTVKNYQKVRDKLKSQITSQSPHLIVNFKNVQRMDKSGIQALLSAISQARLYKGSLKLVGVNQDVMGILNSANIDEKFLEFYETEAEAIRSL